MLLIYQSYNRPSPLNSFFKRNQDLRTVIVTADIHQGLYSPAYITQSVMEISNFQLQIFIQFLIPKFRNFKFYLSFVNYDSKFHPTLCDADHPYLTFWHWSGVTPYTSSFEFAGSCVFGKQSPGNLSLRPSTALGTSVQNNEEFCLPPAIAMLKHLRAGYLNVLFFFFSSINSSTCFRNIQSSGGRALSRSYGRYFAEFLEDLSLVRLSLLDSTTCVGLRYGFLFVMLRSFSGKSAPQYLPHRSGTFSLHLDLRIADLPTIHPYATNTHPIVCIEY